MTYGGDGGGVGSAPAVPAVTTMATTAAAAILTVFIASTFLVLLASPRQVRKKSAAPS
jgi:hypothetical protein